MDDTIRSCKWMLTINNPEKEITEDKDGIITVTKYGYDQIMEKIAQFKNLRYWCMSEEIGLEEKTPHTHLFLLFENQIRFRTIKAIFPHPHIDRCKGTAKEIKDYVYKEGKWQYSVKSETRIEGKQFEGGEMPEEEKGKRADLEEMYGMIKSGMTNIEIFEENPAYIKYLDKIESVRQQYRMDKYKNTWRQLHVTYIWGNTGIGKTRSVMEKYGYENVYRVTNYHNPFDSYKGQDIILFEEFRSNLRIQDMLNYLDGYPLELPSRYNDKVACYTKVYILSNLDFNMQYTDMQVLHSETYKAFCRRVHEIKHMDGKEKEWEQTEFDWK